MSLDSFMVDITPSAWGTVIEIERRNRIKLSVAAYAYEVHSDSIMSDSDFDKLAETINVQVNTENELMDDFFKDHFTSYTGQWIHKHPNKDGLEIIYQKHYIKNKMRVK